MRAEAVAEVLWELKRLERLATFSEICERAGFKPGVGGKNMLTCLEGVRRDWPHLQWWRAVQDSKQIEAKSAHAEALKQNGYALDECADKKGYVQVVSCETHLYSWTSAAAAATEPVA
jgi:hypothetical protein